MTLHHQKRLALRQFAEVVDWNNAKIQHKQIERGRQACRVSPPCRRAAATR